MRRAVDCVAAITALAIGLGMGGYYYLQQQDAQQLAAVSQGLRRFEQVLAFRGASKEAQTSERGWPLTVDPTWFASDAPRNLLITPDRPWLEVATAEQGEFQDPPVRIALSSDTAAFWYNPYKGIIRARVPIAISDQRALELYNRVNGTSLDNIYCADAAPAPKPDAPPEKPLDPKSSASADPLSPNAMPSTTPPSPTNPFKSQPGATPSNQAQVPDSGPR
jgi:hypothetical protein